MLGLQVSAWRRQKRLQLAAEAAARLLPRCLWIFAAAWALDALLFLPREPRLALFALWLAASLAGVWRWALKPQWRLSDLGLLREVGGLRPALAPYLISGWELSLGLCPPGVSPDLSRAHIEEAERAVSEGSVRGLFPLVPGAESRRRWASAAASLVVLGALGLWRPAAAGRVLRPWRDQPLESLIEISPRGADLPWSKPAAIKAVWRGRQEPGLELWVRSPSSPWRRQDWDEPYVYRVASLTEPLDYKLTWRGLRSADYRLSPVSYPAFQDLRLALRYPAYTALAPVVYDRAQDVEVLEGSVIEVSGKPDRPLASAALRVSNLPMALPFSETGDGRRQASFIASGEGTYHWELEDASGLRDPSPVLYRFQTVKDQPPTVEILSPSEDVEASPREPLRLTFEASDDYGLKSVEIRWSVAGTAKTGQKTLYEPEDRPKRYLGDVLWDLGLFASGATVEYRLRAMDGRGQWGESRKASVKITDFEGQHEALRKDLQAQLAKLQALDAKEEKVIQDLARISTEAAEMSQELQYDLADLDQQWQSSADQMESLAQRMEQDPLANPGLQMEYRRTAQSLREAQKEGLPKARQSLQQKEWQKAEVQHGKLDKAVKNALSDLQKGESLQDYQDLAEQADRMESRGKDLEQQLSKMQGKKLSEQDRRKLDEALNDIARQMQELMDAVQRLPQQDPSQAKSKKSLELPLDEAQSEASQLQKALQEGDLQSALKHAKKLADALAKARRALQQAQEQTAAAMMGDDPLSRQMQEAEQDWQELIDQQSKLVDGLAAMEDKRLKERLEAQKSLLQSLAEDQKVLNSSSTAPMELQPLLQSIEQDLRAGRGQDLEGKMRAAAARMFQRPESQALAQQQLGILQRLQASAEPPPDSAAYQKAAARQGELRRRAGGLESRLNGLPVPSKSARALGQAGGEMEQGQGALSGSDGGQGLSHASKALEQLEQGLEKQREEMQQQGQMEGGFKQRQSMSSGGVRPQGGGRTGMRTGFVELPSAADYRPPVELRQEIMRSLQERYPRSYEGVIKDYLKRLSQ